MMRLLIALAVVAGLVGCHRSLPGPPSQQVVNSLSELSVFPDPIDLGQLSPGQQSLAELTVQNHGLNLRTLVKIETSCDCISVDRIPQVIAPGGVVRLRVMFDPTHEPNFRGKLGIDLCGKGALNQELFRTTIHVSIIDTDAND